MAREVFPTKEFQAQAKYFVFVHIDVDEQPGVAQRFGVNAIPDMRFLTKEGKEVHRVIGYRPLGELLQEMERARSMAGG